MSDLAQHIIQVIQSVYGPKASLHEPCLCGKEWHYVKDCLDTNWVSSAGKYVDDFEKKLSEYTGAKRAVVMVNGTAALHMCLKSAGVKAEDEVLVPALTFVATANAVRYCHAYPHFIDCDEKTLGVCAQKLDAYLAKTTKFKSGVAYNKKTGRRISSVIPVHVFGHPVDLDPLIEVCHKYRLVMIEDASESLGSFYKDKHTGRFGKVACLSFNGNKIVTTGGGGALLTDDDELADKVKHITTTAKVNHPWDYFHDEVGYNYRMPNINAALGLAQLEMLPEMLKQKREIAQKYQEGFFVVDGLDFFTEPEFASSNYWLNTIILDNKELKDEILRATNKAGIMTRPCWELLCGLPMYVDCPRMDLEVCKDLAARIINIPSSNTRLSRSTASGRQCD